VEQALPGWKKPGCGYAEVHILDKAEKSDKIKDIAIKQLMHTLHRLIDEENINPGDIAILLRYKNTMKDIVEAFNAQEFKSGSNIKIVSDEAYRLESSLTLQLVISAMRYIASPEDNVNIANLVRLYAKVVEKRDETFEEDTVHKNMADRLPAEFREKLMHFQSLPIYELIEQLLQAIEMSEDKNEEAYIYTFLDHASQYLTNRTSDLNGFIEAWDNEIYDKSIPAEEINSVRLMTIHKSKGLEFHTVIVPFCDWILTGDNRNSLWCTPTEEPYNTLSLLSVPLNKEMPDSIYSKEYNNEFLYQIVDNLNILYVATTRAKSNLFLFSDGTGGKKENISKLLNRIVNSMTALEGSKYENGVFEFGSIVPSEVKSKDKEKDKKPNENPFEAKPQSIRQPFVYHNNRITFRQSKELARFLATDKDEKKQFMNIAEGELLHQLMSGINKADDISKALDRLLIEGLISTDKQYDRIKKLVENAIANPYAADWFTGKYKLYNECSILVNNNETTRRPDRVMINGKEAIVVDYKFAKESDEYPEQVRRYMRLLTQMGYENVRGYLWYVYKNKIEEVKNI
jgi:ATP-dependent exoDNAse (exonuclease V) beta subunit